MLKKIDFKFKLSVGSFKNQNSFNENFESNQIKCLQDAVVSAVKLDMIEGIALEPRMRIAVVINSTIVRASFVVFPVMIL